MYCTNCDALIDFSAQFCYRCGAPSGIQTDGQTPAAVSWPVVRESRYQKLLKIACAITQMGLVMEEIERHEVQGVRALNFFLPDRTPAFSIHPLGRLPLFYDGRWTPISIATSNPAFHSLVERIAKEYHRQTGQAATVVAI